MKFCTAIERPAPIKLWPRCCSSAFMGTTIKPPKAPSRMRNGAATQTLSIKISAITAPPIAMPSGMTRGPSSSRMRSDATMAPTAMPMATTPCKADACVTL